MNAWTSFWTAWAEYFDWRAKVDLTPLQREIQQAREERDAQKQQNREWVEKNRVPDKDP